MKEIFNTSCPAIVPAILLVMYLIQTFRLSNLKDRHKRALSAMGKRSLLRDDMGEAGENNGKLVFVLIALVGIVIILLWHK